MSKYLVTGGCGFIGSHLTDQLIKDGHDVVVFDNLSSGSLDNLHDDAVFIEGDIRDKHALKQIIREVDGCFHLAAIASVDISVKKWSETHETNLTGTINIFESIVERDEGPIPVIYASSAAVYGDNASVPLCETVQPSPLTPYGVDKLSCELHARIAHLIHNIPSVGLRFFNVYGPRQDPSSPYSGVISIFINKIMNDLPVKIFGNGTQTRDFVYVGDVVTMLKTSMQTHDKQCHVLNVCTGRSTSILELANIIASVTHKELKTEFSAPKSGDIHISLGSPEKTLRKLNKNAKTRLGEGLETTVTFIKKPTTTAASENIKILPLDNKLYEENNDRSNL
jgi:UDP-glucose 4-epimerase